MPTFALSEFTAGGLGDNVIVMQHYEVAGTLRRVLAVLRMRLSFFDHTLPELVLDEMGIRIAALDASMLTLLATIAQKRGFGRSLDSV